jgi:energy-coupling factor transport system substrate-specific component
MDQNKLRAKDLVLIAIFNVLQLVIYFAVATILWMITPLYPFCVAVAMIPSGIVWAYLRAKVPKRFGIFIQSVLFAIIVFILGSGWFVSVGLLVGGLLAELLSAIGKYGSFKWNTVGYAVFSVLNNLGVFAIILLSRDYYFNFSTQSGIDPVRMSQLIDLVSGPILLLSCILAVAGAVFGMALGRMFLKKHFERAGIV